MKEDYLHYLWKYKLFRLVENTNIEIKEVGTHNLDSGPDFFNAKVLIDNTLWAGNIEIHIKSSDWLDHGHQFDAAYNNVILHVVYDYNSPVFDANGREIPTLELKNLVSYSNYEEYLSFVKKEIPCDAQLQQIPEILLINTKEKFLIERLARKSEDLKSIFESNKNDWEETTYQLMFKYFGMKVNSDPFYSLAKATPIRLLRKHDDVFQIESILFGNAGFLDEILDEYTSKLNKEYSFLATKYNFQQLNKVSWKFSKIRPQNFPTIRIAQLANLILHNQNFFDLFIRNKSTFSQIQDYLSIKIKEGYWFNHYNFGKESGEKIKSIGDTLISGIVINVIVPLSFLYSETIQDITYKEHALSLLESLPNEENRITKKFNKAIRNKTAFDSQAIIEGYNSYCSLKQCLNCPIGMYVLNKKARS